MSERQQCLSGRQVLEEPEIEAFKAKEVFQRSKRSLGNCLKLQLRLILHFFEANNAAVSTGSNAQAGRTLWNKDVPKWGTSSARRQGLGVSCGAESCSRSTESSAASEPSPPPNTTHRHQPRGTSRVVGEAEEAEKGSPNPWNLICHLLLLPYGHHHPGGWGAGAESRLPGLPLLAPPHVFCCSDLSDRLDTRRGKVPHDGSRHGTLACLLDGRQAACRSPSPHSGNPTWSPLCFIRIHKCIPHCPFGCPTAGRRCFPGSLPRARCSHLGMLSFQALTCRCQHWQYLRGHIQKWACLGIQCHFSLFLYFSNTSLEIS